MRHLFLSCLLAALASSWLGAQTTPVTCEVYFDSGEYVLTSSAQAVLDSLVDHEKLQVIRGVRVTGHTDAVGSDADNETLSRQRALTVARYLRAHGIQARAVRLRADGEANPQASNATRTGRSLNRRVELTVYLGALKAPPSEVVVEAPADSLPTDVSGNEALYDCTQPLTLTGRRGVRIVLPPYAFDSCGEPIEVRLAEFNNLDVVSGKEMSVMAEDTVLESAGSICLSAFMSGQQLRALREGQSVEVRIPAERYDPEMGLYESPNRSNRRAINWERNPNTMPEFDVETNTYVLRVTELGCLNLDKPAVTEMAPPVAVKVRRRMLRRSNLYVEYGQRGTYSQGKILGKKYYVFGSAEEAESLRLKGYLWTRRQRFGVDKRLSRPGIRERSIELDGQSYQLVAKITPRAINRTDRFRSGRSIFGVVLPTIR